MKHLYVAGPKVFFQLMTPSMLSFVSSCDNGTTHSYFGVITVEVTQNIACLMVEVKIKRIVTVCDNFDTLFMKLVV